MDDTPYVNDGADASLRKTVSLLNKIEAKTGSATITGPVTVTNEVEIKNDANNPLPVSDNGGSLTVDGTVELGATSLSALENISVTFPATQNVNVTNAGLSVSVSNLPATQPVSGSVSVLNFPATQPVSLATAPTTPVTGTFWQATQPVSIASAPVTPVTDNGGSLTVDGTVTANVSGTVPVSGTFWQTTQPISGTVTANTGLTQPLTDTQLRASAITVTATDLGVKADAVATTDTGTFSVIALVKRGLQNWTSLLAKIPTLVSGRIPVDGSGVTQPVSGTVTANVTAATSIDSQLGYLYGNNGDDEKQTAVPIGFNNTNDDIFCNVSDQQPLPINGSVSADISPAQVGQGIDYYISQINSAFEIFGTVTANTGLSQPLTDTELRATAVPVSGTITATQATASSLKGQAQILNSSGSLVTYAESGTYGSPSVDVISVQNPQGTSAAIATFTSTTASTSLVSATTARKTLTVYNSGAGDLYISPTATCTTTNFQIRLASNDYWECPAQQVTMAHTAVFSSAGTAYVTTIS